MVRNSRQVPTLVINADLVTNMRFDRFVDSCCSPNAITTAGVFRYKTALPFGVAEQENGILMEVIEKPILHHDVLAGVNLIAEETRLLVQEGERVDMTELLLRARDAGQTVRVRDIEGFWADMGTPQAFAELLSSSQQG
jgi:NDP-sugar pyrophosphorylase family protein